MIYSAADIRQQCCDALLKTPAESENSIGVVSRELEQKHVDAAVFMHKKFGMEIDIHNLHDVIANYKTCKSISKLESAELINGFEIPQGKFNPCHLIEYFKNG